MDAGSFICLPLGLQGISKNNDLVALAHPQSGSLSAILAQIYLAQLAGLTWE